MKTFILNIEDSTQCKELSWSYGDEYENLISVDPNLGNVTAESIFLNKHKKLLSCNVPTSLFLGDILSAFHTNKNPKSPVERIQSAYLADYQRQKLQFISKKTKVPLNFFHPEEIESFPGLMMIFNQASAVPMLRQIMKRIPGAGLMDGGEPMMYSIVPFSKIFEINGPKMNMTRAEVRKKYLEEDPDGFIVIQKMMKMYEIPKALDEPKIICKVHMTARIKYLGSLDNFSTFDPNVLLKYKFD